MNTGLRQRLEEARQRLEAARVAFLRMLIKSS
jgi:hypothetical protein